MRGSLLRVIVGQGLGSLASLLCLLALGRFAGQAELGVFALGWSCLFLALSLTDTLFATPYTYFHAQPRPLAPDLPMAATWGPLALAGGLAALLSLPAALEGRAGPAGEAAALWPWLPLAVATGVLREFRRRHLLASAQPQALLRLDAAGALLQTGGIAALAAGGALGAGSAMACVAAAAAAPLLPLLTRARLSRLWAARASAAAVLRRFFAYGRWLLMGGLCHVLSVQAYPWLAFAAGGTEGAGLWAAANTLVNLLSPLLTALSNHERPRLMQAATRHPPAALRPLVWRRLPLFALPALLLVLGLVAAGAPLLSRLYGEGFVPAGQALPGLGLGLVAVALGAPVQLGLLARGAPSSNLAYHGTALAVLGLVLALAGLPALQPLAQTWALANTLATGVLFAWFLRVTPRHG